MMKVLLSSNDENVLSSKDESDFNLSLRRLWRLLEQSAHGTAHPSKNWCSSTASFLQLESTSTAVTSSVVRLG
jgi:hypothetical protein